MKENPRKVSKSAIKSENALNEKEDFIMLPTVDFCFKELMQNENVRKGIIAAILNKRPDEIVNTYHLPNPFLGLWGEAQYLQFHLDACLI